jgi:phage protein D
VPDINKQPQAAGRQPRGAVTINGRAVPWVSFQVDSNSTFNADTFKVTLAANALPIDLTAAHLIDGRDLAVGVYAGFPSNPQAFSVAELGQLIYGRTDDVHYDPAGGTLELSGRDLTGVFIDRKTSDKFQNLTSSQIASGLALRAGLTPVVTSTTTKAGTYYAIDNARLTLNMSEWELLCYLASQENFAVYVMGRELHFEPKPTPGDAYALQWVPGQGGSSGFSGMSLSLQRNLTVTRDVTVTVRSFSAKKAQVVLATYPQAKHKGASAGTSGTQQPEGHVRTIPGLTREQALQRAQAIHAEITAHEMKLSASLPGDNLLTPFTPVVLRGTGTPYDQTYYPESVLRTMSADEGYRMQLEAKNRAPENDTTV